MNEGKKCFLLAFDTFFSTTLFDPFTQKVEKGRRRSQPPTEATEAPKKQRWGADRPLKTTAALLTGRSLSRLSPIASGQALEWVHTEDSRSTTLSASCWPLVLTGFPHTFLLSFSFSLPAFLSKRTPWTRVSDFSCLCPGKLQDPFPFLFLTRITYIFRASWLLGPAQLLQGWSTPEASLLDRRLAKSTSGSSWPSPGLPLLNPRDPPPGILRALGILAEVEQLRPHSLVRLLATKSPSTLWTTIARGKNGKCRLICDLTSV